jgi:hypothetical protein
MSGAIEDGGNHCVWLQARQAADQFDGVGIGDETMLSSAHLLKAQLRVVAPPPVQQQLHLTAVRSHHDFGKYRAQDALLPLWRAPRMLPQAAQIGPQGKQGLPLWLADSLRALLAQRFEFFFEACVHRQGCIPAPLQFGCYEPVRRIHGVVLPLCASHLIARLFDGQDFLANAVVVGGLMHLQCRHSGLDSKGRSRNASHPAPPPQIRACGATAHGSCLGW